MNTIYSHFNSKYPELASNFNCSYMYFAQPVRRRDVDQYSYLYLHISCQIILFPTIAIVNLVSRYELKHILTHYLLIPSHDMNYFLLCFKKIYEK